MDHYDEEPEAVVPRDQHTVGQRIVSLYKNCGKSAPEVSAYVDRSGLHARCTSKANSLGEGAMGYVVEGDEKDTLVKVTRSANAVSSTWPRAIIDMHRMNRIFSRRPGYAKMALPVTGSMSLCSVDTLVSRRSVLPMIHGRSLAEILGAVFDAEQDESLYFAPADDPFMQDRSRIPVTILTSIISNSDNFDPERHSDILDGVNVEDADYADSIRALADTPDFKPAVDEYHARRLRAIAPAIAEFDAVMAKVLKTVVGMQTFASDTPPYYHNDLHEENIIVDDAGAVWIIDWDEVSGTPKMPLMETGLLHVACERLKDLKDASGDSLYGDLLSQIHARVEDADTRELSEELVRTTTRRTVKIPQEGGAAPGAWLAALAMGAVTVVAAVAGAVRS